MDVSRMIWQIDDDLTVKMKEASSDETGPCFIRRGPLLQLLFSAASLFVTFEH
jgi:hypothetical protein